MSKRSPNRPGSQLERSTAVSSTPTQVRERKLGDLFEYEIEHPVTIRRNQSALVPIVLRGFDGKTVLLYNKANRAENPLRCVDFKNSTGLTLEGGPVTVIEAGNYAGEAMLETMKPGEQRLVPFAVELSVHVLDNVESRSQSVHKVIVRKGTLTAISHLVQQTTYHFDNKGAEDYPLSLEHPRSANWDLIDTPKPDEVTESYWRFRIAIAANKTTKFVVTQKCVMQNVIGLGDLRDEQIRLWIEQKYLDAKTEKALRAVVQIQHEAAGIQIAIQDLENERAKIHLEQTRIRENLQALGDRSAEKDLRERFVRTLNVQEDRLEQIDREVKLKSQERDQCRARIDTALGQLEFEKEIA